jgi:FkbM family methyltransferase
MISPEQVSITLNTYDITPKGVIHIGAHDCEETEFYKKIGIQSLNNIIWIEALQEKVDACVGKGIQNVYQSVISDKDNEIVQFNIADNCQSSSILEPGTHLQHHPNVHFTRQIPLITTTLDSFISKKGLDMSKYNILYMDIQGAELLALKGGKEYIKHVEAIYLEVNTEEVYKKCGLLCEIDNFLVGFRRELTQMTEFGWGDALYVRYKNYAKSVS